MKKSVFLLMMAAAFAFTACSNGKLNPSDEPEIPETNEPVFEMVAQPDFVFSSNENTLFSTLATRATAAPTDGEEEEVVPEVEVNLSVCTANQYKASKLSVHVRSVNDVTVFIPVAANLFSNNDANSLAILLENSSATGVYGETEQEYSVNGNTVKAKVQFVDGGVKVSVTGVNKAVLDYLQETYHDGLTVEVWNYYQNSATLEGLKEGFDAGAKVSFSQKPSLYVNAFAKVPDYVETLGTIKIYSKNVEVSSSEKYYEALGEDKTFLYPFLDEAFTQPLENKYWVRPARNYAVDGEEFVGPSRYYLLKGHKNPYDCVVTPEGVTFAHKEANDATIPADVETRVCVIDANYNVLYY